MSVTPASDTTGSATAPSPVGARRPNGRTSWYGLLAALWPVQRAVLLGCLGGVLLVIAGMFVYRQWSTGVLSDIRSSAVCVGPAGLDAPDCASAISDALLSRLRPAAVLMLLVCAALTAGGGVLLGVAAFARDFEQHTQVLLLSQSVSRARWWGAKVAIVGVPWVLAMVPLGAASSLTTRDGDGSVADPMGPVQFYFSPLGLPLVALVGLGVGAAVSTVVRSTLGALLIAAVLTSGLIVGAELARPHLVPTTRLLSAPNVYAISDAPEGSWFQGTGYLDADGVERGNEVMYTQSCAPLDDPNPTTQKLDEWWGDCLRQAGIVAGYTDVIEPRWFVALRLLWSGLLVAVSALCLLAGFRRIRRRVL